MLPFRLENRDNDVHNANGAIREAQGVPKNRWKPILSSVRSIITLQKKTSSDEKKLTDAVAKLEDDKDTVEKLGDIVKLCDKVLQKCVYVNIQR